ncbi:hypothetical protein D5085_06880 [Ectothiorhodospiraceae bacterium BW-2]|nr:hypothetical protein D5085_06880 [Ectothiorhodospiraceae bacterium BW-2]
MKPAFSDHLFDQVFQRENIRTAWERVRANKGAAGIDEISIDEFPDWVKAGNWKRIIAELKAEQYYPSPVRRVEIEKPNGGKRPLGILDGIPLAMAPSPGFQHQRVAMNMAFQLRQLLDSCPHCQVLYEIDVEFSEDTVVRPDLIVICHTPEGERITRPITA